MKRSLPLRILVASALCVLLLALASGALAASPTVSGNNSYSGVSGQFGGDVGASVSLSGADNSNPADMPTLYFRIQLAQPTGGYIDITSTQPAGDGQVNFSISRDTLNRLPQGTNTITVRSSATATNDAISEHSVGSISVTSPPYKVTVVWTEGGWGYSNPKEATPGETIFIDAKSVEGYYFVNWTILEGHPNLRDKGVPNLEFAMPAENVKVQANFRKNAGSSGSNSSSSGSSNSSSSQTWTTNELVAAPAYTPVMVTTRAVPTTGSVTGTSVDILPAPLASSTSAGTFNQGDDLTMLGYDNGYFAVLVSNTTMGYVDGNQVEFSFEPTISGTLLQNSAVTTTDGQPGTTLNSGTAITVNGRDGANWQITVSGQSYLLPAVNSADQTQTLGLSAEDLTAIAGSYTFPVTGIVHENGVNIRESASTSSRQLGSLQGKASFNAVGYENGFFVVATESGSSGYVLANYTTVSLSPPIYGSITQNAPAYSRSTAQSSYFVKNVPTGSVVALQGRDGNWWRVTVDGEILWIGQEYLNVPTIK